MAHHNPLDPELDPDVEWTPELLQQKLHDYHAAVAKSIKEEFSTGSTATADPKQTEEYVKEFFKKNIANALAQVVWLANNSTSDSVRLSAADKIIKYAIEDSKQHGDPIKDLINELTGVANG